MSDSATLLRIRVEDDPDRSVTVIAPRDAYLNYAFADQLRAPLKEVVAQRLEGGVRHIVLDLASVNVMDSCGLSVVIGLKKAAEAGLASFSLAGLSPVVRRLFTLTKLERVFAIHPDVPTAVRIALTEAEDAAHNASAS